MKKMAYMIILSMVLALSACGKQEITDLKTEIAFKEVQLNEAREKIASLENQISKLEEDVKKAKERTPEYQVATVPFSFEHDDNNTFYIEYVYNATLNKKYIVGYESLYAEGNESLMKADFVTFIDKIYNSIDDYGMVDYKATVGEDTYFFLYMNKALIRNDIISDEVEKLPQDYAASFIRFNDEVDGFLSSVGLK